MQRLDRNPQIGDMIINKFDTGRASQHGMPEPMDFVGVVYEIKYDKWGHADKVRIQWSNGFPPEYNEHYGYRGVNIHNLRHEFDVVRNGVNIP